jgi:uncharacterized protein
MSVMSGKNQLGGFLSGGIVGLLGGLIGLGGAEFRLPILISLFRFDALPAIILNKAMSLVVVATALPFRMTTVGASEIASHWPVIINLLAGSLVGAWVGASWATRLSSMTLYRVIAVLLVLMAGILMFGHGLQGGDTLVHGLAQIVAGVGAGFAIGVVASLMGVAGGELLIPTLMLLFGADIKLAGSLSLAISLPTMIVGFTRYSRDQNFKAIKENSAFVILMILGSIAGTFIGAQLLGIVPESLLIPLLAIILLISAIKVWRHEVKA